MGHGRERAEMTPAPPSLSELFTTFLVVGVSAVGMGIMQAIRTVPVQRGWMTQEDIDEGMGLVQLYPGAIMVDLITYIGYRLRGIRGALVLVVAFVGPSLVLLLGLSWVFYTYKSHRVITDVAIGVERCHRCRGIGGRGPGEPDDRLRVRACHG